MYWKDVQISRKLLIAGCSVIHSMGYIHHDVRPDNFLNDGEGNYILGDLNSVRPIENQNERHVEGSTLFRRLNLFSKKKLNTSIDCYAWGMSFIYLITYLPEPGEGIPKVELKVIEQDDKRFLSYCVLLLNGEIAKSGLHDILFAKIIMKAISEKSEEKYKNAIDLVKELQRYYN